MMTGAIDMNGTIQRLREEFDVREKLTKPVMKAELLEAVRSAAEED
jgi:hypothetical protein